MPIFHDELRLECRTRNNRLWHAIFDTFPNVAEFCRVYKLSNSQVGNWLNLKESPYRRQGLAPSAQRLIEVTGIGAEELFPVALYAGTLPTALVLEMPADRFRSLAAARQFALEGPSPEAQVLEAETKEKVATVIATLSPRKARMIRLAYGFEDGREWSNREIAAEFNLSHSRVGQILANVHRTLRRPLYSRFLRKLERTNG